MSVDSSLDAGKRKRDASEQGVALIQRMIGDPVLGCKLEQTKSLVLGFGDKSGRVICFKHGDTQAIIWEQVIAEGVHITALATSLDEQTCLVGTSAGELHILNTASGATITKTTTPNNIGVCGLAYIGVEDSEFAAFAEDGTIHHWRLVREASQAEGRTLDCIGSYIAHGVWGTAMCVLCTTPTGMEGGVAVTGDSSGEVRLWDIKDGWRCLGAMQLHQSAIRSIRPHPQLAQFVSVSSDGSMCIVDVSTATPSEDQLKALGMRAVREAEGGTAGEDCSVETQSVSGCGMVVVPDNTSSSTSAAQGTVGSNPNVSTTTPASPVPPIPPTPLSPIPATTPREDNASGCSSPVIPTPADSVLPLLVPHMSVRSVTVVAPGQWCLYADFSPDGGQVVATGQSGEILLVDVSTHQVTQRLKNLSDWPSFATFVPHATGDDAAAAAESGKSVPMQVIFALVDTASGLYTWDIEAGRSQGLDATKRTAGSLADEVDTTA